MRRFQYDRGRWYIMLWSNSYFGTEVYKTKTVYFSNVDRMLLFEKMNMCYTMLDYQIDKMDYQKYKL